MGLQKEKDKLQEEISMTFQVLILVEKKEGEMKAYVGKSYGISIVILCVVEEIEKLQGTIGIQIKAHADLQKEKDGIAMQLNVAQKKNEELTKQLNDIKRTLEEKITALQKEKDGIATQLNVAQKKNEELTKQLNDIKRTLEEKITVLQKEKDGIATELNVAQKKNEELAKQLIDIKRTLEEKIIVLQKKKDELEKRLNDITNEKIKLEKQFEAIQMEKDRLVSLYP